jgi:Nif-specific regulatory protein
MGATLLKLDGKEQTRYSLDPAGCFKIGRHRSNQLVAQDEHCSRHHAEIVFDGNRWILNDLESQNGSYVNGKRVKSALLEDGQELRFGSLLLRFELSESTNGDSSASDSEESDTSIRQDSALAMLDETTFLADQLSALCHYMAETVHEGDAYRMVSRALQVVQATIRADVVGFLGLDETGRVVPQVILPANSEVDLRLSTHLTDKVQELRKPIWLHGEGLNLASESLVNYTDAIGVPMPGADSWLGALHAYRRGKPFTAQDPKFCEVVARHLADSLRLLRSRRQLQSENARLRQQLPLAERLVGSSEAIKTLQRMIDRLSAQASTVLIRGESGVGKELVAQALHQQSPRAEGPLEVMNCAAIPGELVESHLFGHKRGAFTGAVTDRVGCFLKADGGTLFLDEIGEMPLPCQAKLLRVLEDGTFKPLGSDETVRVRVRVIAATNRDLDAAVKEASFRKDLLYRLTIVEIPVPPLRDHLEDIPELVDYYLKVLERKCGRRCRLTPQALNRLKKHTWPGNVRELVGVLESAVILAESTLIDVPDLRVRGDATPQTLPTLNLADLEQLAYEEAWEQAGRDVKEVVNLLGVSRTTAYTKLKELGLIS